MTEIELFAGAKILQLVLESIDVQGHLWGSLRGQVMGAVAPQLQARLFTELWDLMVEPVRNRLGRTVTEIIEGEHRV